MTTESILVIELWPHESECWLCGRDLVGAQHGVPFYEDLLLPNDWPGEWGGFDACRRCYDFQQTISEPMTREEALSALVVCFDGEPQP